METYSFGGGGFKLGERVEILTTGQRGVLISEIVHISGCNTYQVLLQNVVSEGKMRIAHRDHLMLRKLEQAESIFDGTRELTDENSFSQRSTNANAERIREAVKDNKEFIPEIDDAAGIEEISILPGTEVWNKVYCKTMFVSYICREIFSKELVYGLTYMSEDKEIMVTSHSYALVELENIIKINLESKKGPFFEDGHDMIQAGMMLPRDILVPRDI